MRAAPAPRYRRAASGWTSAGGDTLAVFGQGPVGLSATLLGAAMGARVIAVETNAERQAAGEGVRRGRDAIDSRGRLKHQGADQGEGADFAAGMHQRLRRARVAAVRCAKTWGTVCFVGEGGDVTLDVSRDMLRQQLTLIGSWTFSAMGMAECARFVVDNSITLERIFSHRWQLEQADEAYEALRHAIDRQRVSSFSKKEEANETIASVAGSRLHWRS